MLLQIVSHLKYIVNNKREAETFSAFESPDAARSRRASKEAFMPEEATKQSAPPCRLGDRPFANAPGAVAGGGERFLHPCKRGFPGEMAKQSCAAMPVGGSPFRQRASAGGGQRGTLSHRVKRFRQGKRRNKARRHGREIALSPTRRPQPRAADGGAEGRVKGFCCTKSIAGERAFSPVRARCPFRRRVQSRDARKTGRRSRCPYTGKSSGPVPGAQAH